VIKRTADGDRVNHFAGLIDRLGSITPMCMPLAGAHHFTLPSKSGALGSGVQAARLRRARCLLTEKSIAEIASWTEPLRNSSTETPA
jgi:hypothetical protein